MIKFEASLTSPEYKIFLVMKFESALTWIIRELRLHGVQKEIIDLSLKLDGRPFAGENTVIFSKYSVPYNIFPDSFIVFCNNCVALKKEKHRNNLNHQ